MNNKIIHAPTLEQMAAVARQKRAQEALVKTAQKGRDIKCLKCQGIAFTPAVVIRTLPPGESGVNQRTFATRQVWQCAKPGCGYVFDPDNLSHGMEPEN